MKHRSRAFVRADVVESGQMKAELHVALYFKKFRNRTFKFQKILEKKFWT
jgi:hypothetical protein